MIDLYEIVFLDLLRGDSSVFCGLVPGFLPRFDEVFFCLGLVFGFARQKALTFTPSVLENDFTQEQLFFCSHAAFDIPLHSLAIEGVPTSRNAENSVQRTKIGR